MIFWILLGVIVLSVVWVISMYNGLVKLKVRVEEAWADIEVQLKRRYNLIPNLVNTVKGYATHEKELFENVTKARANAMNAQGVEEKGKAENMLSGTLKSLFAVAENYPNLKANENFLSLQADLTDTEDKIMYSRRFYNGNVRDLNTKIQVFPSNIIANSFGFKMREMFEVENSEERKAVEVKF
ncbi:hypothetical protein A2526_03865 [candidate division WOR-1 bacterium RIFOXYD2_FULL_36_8]|uniref:LemA family protein n=1 Tax=candidate division WOR-1 bacterium RIFOXYB2_FULL_36_35 TaxID=1802578 RepID=A0A1F4S622_UNCSA|nr:MAG: hypothetical protein A2230_02080 [candidate division WOR-1 bacterium RIFOXYA2_FULL_36_21]OGC15860.1 MAG: hypothetical protein A2290_05945 [candidate division WOR-1 bacterium RIFOXYB2_FULL_36_35]OGC21188.1 MAG: hypothetical protein A2282_05945 [candidate division WOR-1 bacterium RIFOXYA12_FULL_36_13]OGC38814.1 MAG: hypothetical protein A2526_03865 [candidate division WOR-1 bacterium RIFOXYD2_FULL_36_8]